MIDLWTSRREMFNKCTWWAQVEDSPYVESSRLAYKDIPEGDFYAKEINAVNISNQIVENNFMIEMQSVTLLTTDDISAMKRNDRVLYDNRYWRVDSIQVEKKKKQRQYMTNQYSCVYYLTLRS